MASEAPPFWWQAPDWRAYALYPISAIYGTVARRRMTAARREPIDVPVLCVGNFTVGGAGKTPVAIALAKQAKKMHLTPMHYRNVVRIDKAKLLLADRSLTVDAVAERLGFGDPKYFARVFKDLAGMSPSAYRRTNVAE